MRGEITTRDEPIGTLRRAGRLALAAGLMGTLALLGVPPAHAHEGACEASVPGCHVASGCHAEPACGHAPRGCQSTAWSRYARRRGFRGASNGGWGAIRGHLTGKQRVRRAFLRGYFLRRYPLIISSTPYYGRTAGTLVDDLDLTAGGGLVLMDAVPGESAPSSLDAIERLNRGMARFHHADYREAARDFDAALSARPDLHGARIGRALCSIVAGRLDRAVDQLDRLARAGELRRSDRLAVNEAFGRAGAFDALLDGLRLRLDLRPDDGDVNLLTAWALLAGDRGADADVLLKRAARTHGERAAWQALSQKAPADATRAPDIRPATMPASSPETPSRGMRAPAALPPIVADGGQPS